MKDEYGKERKSGDKEIPYVTVKPHSKCLLHEPDLPDCPFIIFLAHDKNWVQILTLSIMSSVNLYIISLGFILCYNMELWGEKKDPLSLFHKNLYRNINYLGSK